MMDYIEFDDGFAIAKTAAARELHGRPLSESMPRTRHGVTVVGVKRPSQGFTHAVPGTVVEPGDLLIVSGTRSEVERFSSWIEAPPAR